MWPESWRWLATAWVAVLGVVAGAAPPKFLAVLLVVVATLALVVGWEYGAWCCSRGRKVAHGADDHSWPR